MNSDPGSSDAVHALSALQDVIREHERGARKASILAIFSAVHDILERAQEPVPLRIIYESLVARGVAIGGRDPRHNLAQKLHAEKSFKAYGRRGWFFSDAEPAHAASNYTSNEEDPGDTVTGVHSHTRSEQVVVEASSAPSGRDLIVSSAAQPQARERGTEWRG